MIPAHRRDGEQTIAVWLATSRLPDEYKKRLLNLDMRGVLGPPGDCGSVGEWGRLADWSARRDDRVDDHDEEQDQHTNRHANLDVVERGPSVVIGAPGAHMDIVEKRLLFSPSC